MKSTASEPGLTAHYTWEELITAGYGLLITIRPASNVVPLPCQTKLIELNSTLARHYIIARRLKPSQCYRRVARKALPRYTAVPRLGFKRRAAAVPNSIHRL